MRPRTCTHPAFGNGTSAPYRPGRSAVASGIAYAYAYAYAYAGQLNRSLGLGLHTGREDRGCAHLHILRHRLIAAIHGDDRLHRVRLVHAIRNRIPVRLREHVAHRELLVGRDGLVPRLVRAALLGPPRGLARGEHAERLAV